MIFNGLVSEAVMMCGFVFHGRVLLTKAVYTDVVALKSVHFTYCILDCAFLGGGKKSWKQLPVALVAA